ncbi:GNAT family N-acetyltransferase [[Limnothrix rosea] IAM M-220]|uniref:GNAT family N-acetyltransferase n=1 Tax=[Limnothrix rosea] IAM M-220 TaxID=454133 RepID=UPI001F2BB54E|nr:GNAT family N-acetyltransferase [[Limnothrix rosea] IAM M-220]
MDRALLLRFLHRSYCEFYPDTGFEHLQNTLQNYFTAATPLWWVRNSAGVAVGCLWLGNSIDQIRGDRHSHIFLIYVLPDYRRRGLGSALMQTAEDYAKSRGDRHITLQVFTANETAQALYQKREFQPYSLLMKKSFS